MCLLTSQLLIKSPTGGYRQGLDELGELDSSILQRDRHGGCEHLVLSSASFLSCYDVLDAFD